MSQEVTIDSTGEFVRSPSRFDERITADGSSRWPVEPGRYRLVVSLACPWAHRSIIVRRLLGLEDAISLAIADPIQDERSWRFTLDSDGRDPVLGIRYLSEAYHAADPNYTGGVSVPAIVDVPSGQLVTNDYPQITLDLSTQWRAHHRPGAPDLYPEALREEIDEVNELVFRDVNNGVYRAGFAQRQETYQRAFDALFSRFDWLAQRLASRRYLVGESITEADIRLFTTLVRFDGVYHGHFKCNREKLSENPVLWAYARDLYQTPGFGDTVNFDHIKRHYHLVHTQLNPSGIVPAGPQLSWWELPHGREELGGAPFGEGTPPTPLGSGGVRSGGDVPMTDMTDMAEPVDIEDVPEELRSRILAATAHAEHRRTTSKRGGPAAETEYTVEAVAGDRLTIMDLTLRADGSVAETTHSVTLDDIIEVRERAEGAEVMFRQAGGTRELPVSVETAQRLRRTR